MQFLYSFFSVFNATPPTHIYTLSLHDALPIWAVDARDAGRLVDRVHEERARRVDVRPERELILRARAPEVPGVLEQVHRDRKSTRLNSSHGYISYAVFCLKKKKKSQDPTSQSH